MKEIISVVVFGYLILLSVVSYNFNSPFSYIVLVLIEKIRQTLTTVFDHISKHFNVLPSPARSQNTNY